MDIETDGPQFVASPAQLFAGMAVGLPSLVVVCAHCERRLQAGKTVSVYAYRPAEDSRWYLGRTCCAACAPETIPTPTLGTAECRLTAHLAVHSDAVTQQHRLCLTDPTLVALAPPAEGTAP